MLPTDQLNVLIPYFTQTRGWTPSDITDPASIGRLVLVPLTVVLGNLIIRFGAKRVFCLLLFLQGIAEALVAVDASLNLVRIAEFFFPILCVGTLMATFSLVKNWFREWRGTALGIVTCVAPLSNAITIKFLPAGSNAIGFTPTLLIVSGIICVFGLIGFAIVRDTPELVGCYPDAKRVPPPPEGYADEEAVKDIKFFHVLKHKESWFHICIFGIMLSSLTVYPAFFVNRFIDELGYSPLKLTAFTFAFSILGICLSFVSGFIDDKIGTRRASIGLTVLFLCGTIGLRFGGPGKDWMIWIGIVALGAVVGAAENYNPSMLLHTFGSKCFDHAFKWTYTVLNIFPAAALWLTGMLFTKTGSFNTMYSIEIVLGAITVILMILDKKKVDLTADVIGAESSDFVKAEK
jgi:nitrate/nitrite transporter NarK